MKTFVLAWGLSSLVDAIKDWFFGDILFSLDKLLLHLLDAIYNTFSVFVGMRNVTYRNDSTQNLISIFFSDSNISTIYMGMELIGIALAFGFAIFSVMRKVFDASEKVKTSLAGIVKNLCKSILLIFLMNFIILAVLNSTNVLMTQISYLFDNAPAIANNIEITFDNDEYKAMARVLDTIGNYSINQSRGSRYNINSCYNAILQDMRFLEEREVFKYSYEDYSYDGETVVYSEKTKPTWQYILAKIARAHDLSKEQPIDEYSAEISEAIEEAMVVIETMDNFKALESYKRPAIKIKSDSVSMDRIVFLVGTIDSAKNSRYNANAGLFDGLRADYMNGNKNIYNFDTVKKDFDMYSFGCHFMICIVALMLSYEFLKISLNAVARIFNMLLLYLAFPPFAATMALDDGAKVKQWTTAFIVQSFSVFGTLISVRLLMIVIPIIFNSNLELFSNTYYNSIAKLAFLIGISFTVEKAGSVITGILADQAGFQSVTAGNAGSAAAGAMLGTAASAGGKAFGIGKSIGGKAAGAVGKAGGSLWNRTGGRMLDKMGVTDFASKASNSVKSAVSGWLGSGSQTARNRAHQADFRRRQLKNNLKAGDYSTRQNAKSELANMGETIAREVYGMSGKQYNELKQQYLGDSGGSSSGAGAGMSGAGMSGAGTNMSGTGTSGTGTNMSGTGMSGTGTNESSQNTSQGQTQNQPQNQSQNQPQNQSQNQSQNQTNNTSGGANGLAGGRGRAMSVPNRNGGSKKKHENGQVGGGSGRTSGSSANQTSSPQKVTIPTSGAMQGQSSQNIGNNSNSNSNSNSNNNNNGNSNSSNNRNNNNSNNNNSSNNRLSYSESTDRIQNNDLNSSQQPQRALGPEGAASSNNGNLSNSDSNDSGNNNDSNTARSVPHVMSNRQNNGNSETASPNQVNLANNSSSSNISVQENAQNMTNTVNRIYSDPAVQKQSGQRSSLGQRTFGTTNNSTRERRSNSVPKKVTPPKNNDN